MQHYCQVTSLLNILVKGCTGFLGRYLIEKLAPHFVSVLGRSRSNSNDLVYHYGLIDNKSCYEKRCKI